MPKAILVIEKQYSVEIGACFLMETTHTVQYSPQLGLLQNRTPRYPHTSADNTGLVCMVYTRRTIRNV